MWRGGISFLRRFFCSFVSILVCEGINRVKEDKMNWMRKEGIRRG